MSKIENTAENKSKFFAIYWRQKVMRTDQTALILCDPLAIGHGDWFLELTPLSQITDDDLVNIYHIYSGISYYDYTMDFKDVLTMAKHWRYMEDEMWQSNVIKYTKCSFYLISKGYYAGDGSEIQYNWVKLKGE